MIIYIILLLYILVLSRVKLSKKAIVVFSFVPLTFFSAFRASSVGNDLRNYTELFQRFSILPWNSLFITTVEPGFVVFCKLISIFSSDTQWFVFATSAFVSFFFAKAIYENSLDIGLSIFLYIGFYFYLYSFSAIRQYMAISLALNAFYYFKRGKTKRSFLFLVFAVSFHYSSLVMIVAILLSKLRMNKKNLLLIAIVCMIGVAMFRTVLAHIINTYDRFVYYRDELENFVGRGWSINILLYVFESVVIFWGIYILKSKIRFGSSSFKEAKCAPKYNDIYANMICIMISLSLYIVSVSLTIAARLNHYFTIFIITYIPMLLSELSKKNKAIIRIILELLFIVYFVLMLSRNNWYVVPYVFCW